MHVFSSSSLHQHFQHQNLAARSLINPLNWSGRVFGGCWQCWGCSLHQRTSSSRSTLPVSWLTKLTNPFSPPLILPWTHTPEREEHKNCKRLPTGHKFAKSMKSCHLIIFHLKISPLPLGFHGGFQTRSAPLRSSPRPSRSPSTRCPSRPRSSSPVPPSALSSTSPGNSLRWSRSCARSPLFLICGRARPCKCPALLGMRGQGGCGRCDKGGAWGDRN